MSICEVVDVKAREGGGTGKRGLNLARYTGSKLSPSGTASASETYFSPLSQEQALHTDKMVLPAIVQYGCKGFFTSFYRKLYKHQLVFQGCHL